MERRKIPSRIRIRLRRTAWASIFPKLSPRARRLAIEKGSDAPARNEKAGWMRSWSEHPCQGTWVVLKATRAQKPLAGKASWSVHKCIASASIRNITKPRKTSIDGTRGTEAAAAETEGDVAKLAPQ